MALKDVFAQIKDLSFGIQELLFAVLPVSGGYSGANGTEGIDLSEADYTPPATANGCIRKVFCAGDAGNVKFELADGSVHVLPVASQDYLFPVAMFITKIYKTGTTATVLKVFW